ncbi:DUF924 family protein [Acanthopleuribacter pedis]|uniref:DUF924 domain-containing protein n=1 Tax=Acanthopleuribacter pedis TaxID=442870 RepID=A0A8J7U6A8_9BACT|nr:DUF924 family protein [Acanthopleuribacter pedis]MBO1321719.1 DUF924 domain-containing protein [Acanthopleuribacter pedis]
MDDQAILDFWFGPCDEAGWPAPEQAKLWWSSGAETDETIRAQFGTAVEEAMAGTRPVADTAESHLATIILLDQFTRNIYRGTAQAFAADNRALALARQAVERGYDQQMSPVHRTFFYMPLEHAESQEAQRDSLALFNKLRREQTDHPRAAEFKNFYDFAVQHAEIIARFGRYPHRNKVLGRTPSEEEESYLTGGGASFGQG